MGQGQSAAREPTATEMRCWGVTSRLDALTPSDTISKVPTAQPGMLVIKVAAAGVHPHDIVRPIHSHGSRYPAICGTDGAGVVHEIGEGVTGWTVGAWALFRAPARSQSGSWAQYIVVESAFVVPYPAQVGLQYAAALPTPWWSAQLIYDYLIPRSSGKSTGSALIVGADCENGLEMYLFDLLKAAPTPWEVSVLCDDRKESIYREHGFDVVVPAKAIPRHESGVLNLPVALRGTSPTGSAAHPGVEPSVYHDVIVVLRPEVVGLRSGKELATVSKFGATIVVVDTSTTGSAAPPTAATQPVAQSLTKAVAGFDVLSADLVMVGANIRLFNLDAWVLAMPGVVSEIAHRGPPARLIHADSVPRERALEAIAALAAHRVRTKVSMILAPAANQASEGNMGGAALVVLPTALHSHKEQPTILNDEEMNPATHAAGQQHGVKHLDGEVVAAQG